MFQYVTNFKQIGNCVSVENLFIIVEFHRIIVFWKKKYSSGMCYINYHKLSLFLPKLFKINWKKTYI